MPQAGKELQDRIIERFGSLDDNGPYKFLRDHGYSLSRSWEWSKPGISSLKDMTREEFECLLFLCHEWDYGTLAE